MTTSKEITREQAEIRMDEIWADPNNNYCRGAGEVNFTTVSDLVKSIRDAGVLFQPICVVPYTRLGTNFKYRLVAGFRRYTAIKFLQWETIPATILNGMTEEDILFTNVTENLDRKDLNILDEARAIRRYVELGYDAQSIGKKFGRGYQWAHVRIVLLSLPEGVQKQAAAGLITAKEIETLGRAKKKVDSGLMPAETFTKMVGETVDFRLRARKRNAAALSRAHQKQLQQEENRVREKKFRTEAEIARMQGTLISLFGTNLASRGLAWASCQVKGKDFLEDVKKEAELYGIPFEIPYEYKSDHSL